MPKITFLIGNEKKVIETEKGKTILEIAQKNDIPIVSACGGMGVCTTCMCMVQENPKNLSEPNDAEKNMGMDDGINRLACQAKIDGDLTVAL
jgi:2Fe-2S ferredoxin